MKGEGCVAQSRAAKGVIGRKWQNVSHARRADRMARAHGRQSATKEINAGRGMADWPSELAAESSHRRREEVARAARRRHPSARRVRGNRWDECGVRAQAPVFLYIPPRPRRRRLARRVFFVLPPRRRRHTQLRTIATLPHLSTA